MTSTTSRKNGSSTLWNFLKIVLALGLLVYIVSKAGPANIVATLRSASIFWLILSAALYILLTLLKALQYYVLMPGQLTYPQVLNLIIWQNAVSNFLLAGAGIATYITMTRLEHEVKVSRSVTIFILTKVGDLIAVWLALLAASRLVWPELGILKTPVQILLIAIGVVILFFLLTLLFRQRFVSGVNEILKRLRLSKLRFVEKGLSYLQSLAEIDQKKVFTTFSLLLVYSCLYLGVTLIASYTNFVIFDLHLDPMAVVFVSLLIQLVSYFPIAVFGGLGIAETSALYFWSFFEIPESELAPALIGIRLVFYLFNLIPLIYLPLYSASRRPHEQARSGK